MLMCVWGGGGCEKYYDVPTNITEFTFHIGFEFVIMYIFLPAASVTTTLRLSEPSSALAAQAAALLACKFSTLVFPAADRYPAGFANSK